jgi:hypothetical protein
MTDSSQLTEQEVLRFILDRIDSVPHLEALLLLWESRPKVWTEEELARRLYVKTDVARTLLQDLVRQSLIVNVPGDANLYAYESTSAELDSLVSAVEAKYRVEIVAISTMIHRKASSAVRGFAEAFRFTKERP